jgi:energy-coupling factor transport system permease protein
MSLVAEYVTENSVLHRLSPVTKMIWVLGMGSLCVLFGTPVPLLILLCLVISLGYLGQVQASLYSFIRSFVWVALTIFLMQLFFFRGGRVFFHLVPGWAWTAVTEDGLGFGVAMVLRTLAMTSLVPLLLCTTEMKDLVVALVEKLHFPPDYALMLVTILRFIPTFLVELDQITLAQRARGYKNDGRWPWQRWKGIIPVTVPLVRNALVRAQNLAVAMQLRGYGGGKRTFLCSVESGLADRIAVAFISVIVMLGLTLRISKIL